MDDVFYTHPGLSVTWREDECTIDADSTAMRGWIHRPGREWPAAAMECYDRMVATFHAGTLVDLELYADGALLGYDDERTQDLTSAELAAFAEDCAAVYTRCGCIHA